MSGAIGVEATAVSRLPAGSGFVAAALTTAVVGATAAGAIVQGPQWRLQLEVGVDLALVEATAGLAIVLTGWTVARSQAASAWGMLVLAVGVALPVWAGWPDLPVWARAIAAASTPLAIAGTAQTALCWSRSRRLGRPLVAVHALAVSAVVAQLLLLNPLAELACRRLCISFPAVGSGFLSPSDAVGLVAVLSCAAAITGGLALARWRSTVPATLRIGGVIALGGLGAGAVLRSLGRFRPELADMSVLAVPLSAIALCAAVVVEMSRVAAGRARAAQTLERLTAADVVVGRSVERIGYAMPEPDRWVDASGHGVEPDHARSITLSTAAGPVAVLSVDTSRNLPTLVSTISPAVLLRLRNAQLSAVTRARIAETVQSRRRIAESSDSEARRIERDLHDGAQQRLVSALLHLKIATAHLDPIPLEIVDAETHVRDALDAVRRVSRGAVPATLRDEGLDAALREAAGRSAASVVIDCPLPDTMDASDAAGALYRVAEEAVRSAAPDATVLITAGVRGVELVMRIEADDVSGDRARFENAEDHVVALGGDLVIRDRGKTGLEIEVKVPCES